MLGDFGLRLDEMKGKFGEDLRGKDCRRGEQDGRKKEGKGLAPDLSQGLTGQDVGPARH